MSAKQYVVLSSNVKPDRFLYIAFDRFVGNNRNRSDKDMNYGHLLQVKINLLQAVAYLHENETTSIRFFA